MWQGRTLLRGRENLRFRRSSVCTVPYALRTAPDEAVGGSDRKRHPKKIYANQASWPQGFSRAQGLQWVHGGCKRQIQCQIRGFEGIAGDGIPLTISFQRRTERPPVPAPATQTPTSTARRVIAAEFKTCPPVQSSAHLRPSLGSRCSPAGTSWGTFQPK
jgi:hypothetical protein